MHERAQSELYASIATLDQLKKLYDVGAIDPARLYMFVFCSSSIVGEYGNKS